MSWSIISAADVAPQAWRNGGGRTRELLAWPHSHDWLLRISVADIETDGPFSKFEGVDRWFAVLDGAGVRLFGHELRAGEPLLQFDGAAAPDCKLIDGVTRDFNLMHRRGKGRLRVQPAGTALAPVSARWVGLFTAAGGVLSHGGRAMPLAALSLAWCEAPSAQTCSFEGNGSAWWMSWQEDAES